MFTNGSAAIFTGSVVDEPTASVCTTYDVKINGSVVTEGKPKSE